MKQAAIKLVHIIIFLALLASFTPMQDVNAAGLCYVNSNAVSGTNNGTSWLNAYINLQSAIADTCTEIWVAAGTYKPHASDRSVSFTLENGVAIYGGFDGTEALRNERDYLINSTILSGDLLGNDTGFTNNNENSYHVVIGSDTNSTAILDGFTIKNGNANGSFPNNAAGGLYINNGSPILTNLTISENTAKDGGGGMFNYSNSNPTMSNIIFNNNKSVNGGALLNNSSSPILTNIIFDNNYGHNGGAVFNDNNSRPVLTNITISNNTAQWGGGIFNEASSPIITNTTLAGNTAYQGDGGITNANNSNPTLNNVTISSNNSAIYGVIRNYGNSNPTIYNSILWNNSAGISNISGSATIKDSIIQGGCPVSSICTNTFNNDPKLKILTNNGGFTKTIALSPESPAVDAGGVNFSCASSDQRGVARPLDGNADGIASCDIGAFEFEYNIKTPVVLVHGWQGGALFDGNSNTNGYTCDGIEKYPNRESTLQPVPDLTGYSHLAEWLEADGYQVWIAHLNSNSLHTDTLEQNANCLQQQIQTVWEENPQDITIIAHSMGGLVSRAAINHLPSEIKIRSLYTLGSPHAGIPLTTLGRFVGFGNLSYCDIQPAVCQMSPQYMALYNLVNPNKDGVEYAFIGGDGGSGIMNLALRATGQGPNDGLVGQYSAVGWIYDEQVSSLTNWAFNAEEYFTNETHPASSSANLAYYVAPDMAGSQSYQCIKGLMQNPPNEGNCSSSPSGNSLRTQEQAATSLSIDPYVFSETHTGNLGASATTSHSIIIDSSGVTTFFLNWSGGAAPTVILTRPDAVEITEQYAVEHPTEVTYEEGAGTAESVPYQAFTFPETQTGVWQVNITASSDPIDYQVFAMMESNRTLIAETDKDVYTIGDNAVITATLAQNTTAIIGATVNATLTFQDSSNAVVPLIDPENDGTYASSYTMPDKAGYLTIDVNASGSDNGVPFTRNTNVISAIASNNLQLTGNYDDQPRDDGTDGIYDYLDFTFEVNLTEAGEYAVSAELYSGDQFITQSGDFFTLNSDVQIITLPFYGKDINTSELNGPYTIKNLYLTPIDIGITAASLETVWTTEPYLYSQFTDEINPEIGTITRAGTSPTAATSVDFTVTFSESVTNVDVDDFDLTTSGVTGATITEVNGSGAEYTVTVNTGTGSGTIRLDVLTSADITDLAENLLAGLPYEGGETYDIQKRVVFRSIAAQDGWILESSETSNKGGTLNKGASTLNMGDDAANKQYRAVLSFDTTLPEGAVITKATLRFRYAGKTGTLPFSTHGKLLVDVKNGAFSNNLALQNGDFSAGANKNALFSLGKSTSWFTKVFTASQLSFINTSGVTQFRLRFAKDDNNDLGADLLKIYSGSAGEANRPQLIVEYYIP